MTVSELLILGAAGLFAGILAGFLGIGGGTVLVPLLVALKYAPVQAVATSGLSIVITALSGSIQNWRMGYLNLSQVAGIGFPAVITAQIGAYLAGIFPPYLLLVTFGLLLWLNIYLIEVRKRLTAKKVEEEGEGEDTKESGSIPNSQLPITNSQLPITNHQLPNNSSILFNPTFAKIATGSAAGLLAGLFGVGGGVIMVPLQILLLGESIKKAIQTSLGVIVITAISATAGHAARGNVLWVVGLILGCGGLLGAQISTRFLPRLSDRTISLAFRSLLAILSIYIFWQAWQKFRY
ncbi:MAG: sulfite exporter TauE/SafE family protein [Microcoleus sp. PH2017_29_MFU_D_A]|uniref:sulfite exporter TauE/SafE family protein n=1 Tax=unclassified Microcoleus TaxID=2642155 RepID=UPI001DAC54FD|nr:MULTISPECIES: sulfite exporter TauE/SafE family protein [unclassified Microcoleus]MCC3420395.1 sulfite exporter TauE/SafE family protein [Microcoleus sp. PH2017_07_MST_O_A]MCC3430074.1 sulfite exporter TauE/SafE family protein [Microcoleus sp. PH2017_04_SCI_O_A]MCC3442507.1 sulfite exporter TauE/SafE family protein [Microcoleus sp. PH2017_03_ELD_O_A]MCC3466765.1 sulfite exporter TauE/SafE family protein [Microcoleus sp. PH2017_06_SFM_O_A]MCC3504782.1 sulfite exporter TauE/SafE family protei